MSEAPHVPVLSERERQILQLACDGHTDQAIANELGISLATVGTYWGRIRSKVGHLNRAELVANYMKERSQTMIAKLRAENARLTAEIRARSIDSPRANQMDVFSLIVQSAPEAILVFDAEGYVRMANESAEQMFGYAKCELVGEHLRALVPSRFHGRHSLLRRQYMRNPAKRRMGENSATTAMRRDGAEFPILASLNTAETSRGTLVVCVIREMAT